MQIKHRGLRRFHEHGDGSRLNPDHLIRCKRILGLLGTAEKPSHMAIPGFQLHPLKGDRKGQWSVSVSGNWRIVFRFENNAAVDVDLVDYH